LMNGCFTAVTLFVVSCCHICCMSQLNCRLLKINTKKYEKTKRVDITITQQLRFTSKPKMGNYRKIYNLAAL
jgi:hypothetical protein